jgi:molybdenum cofactor biosynthesis enzyme MoaA
MTKFEIVEPSEKASFGIIPYLTIPLIKVCTQKCTYCGDGAEMTLSDRRQFATEDVLAWFETALDLGVTKVRITGGEPLIHRDFHLILHTVAAKMSTVLVNTNGTLLERFPTKWDDAPDNCQFVVNYHGATEETYDAVAGTKGHYPIVRRGIERLNRRGYLYRLNAVLNARNFHEIWQIIDYCRELGVNLKIQDVVSVPWAFNEWNDVFVSSAQLERDLEARASHIRDHEYAKAFGTPTKIYTVDGVDITLKSVRNGAQYDVKGICGSCAYFPCHEGVYDMFAFADNSLWACNWVDIAKAPGQTRRDKLAYMIALFQRAQYLPAKERQRSMEAPKTPVAQALEFVDSNSFDIEGVGSAG